MLLSASVIWLLLSQVLCLSRGVMAARSARAQQSVSGARARASLTLLSSLFQVSAEGERRASYASRADFADTRLAEDFAIKPCLYLYIFFLCVCVSFTQKQTKKKKKRKEEE